jgi:5-methylcytosine-specific restriction protein A
MRRALRNCATPGCGNLVRGAGRCAKHGHPWKGWHHAGESRQARGYGAEFERNRKTVMLEERICGVCGEAGLPDDEVDHVLPLAKGGGNERANLRRAHRRCNLARVGR